MQPLFAPEGVQCSPISTSTSGRTQSTLAASYTSAPPPSVWRIPSNPEPSVHSDAMPSSPHQVDLVDEDQGPPPPPPPPEDLPLCSMAANGHCPRGEICPFLHGELCPGCEKECLHPFNMRQRNEHMLECEQKQLGAESLQASRDLECAVCLEVVHSKARLSERRFGILPECSHAFCLECIRNWRQNAITATQSQACRACPLCRTKSFYVVPSVTWPQSPEEKERLLAGYRQKTASVPCKHFAFGEGSCAFGASCFYAHRTRDGREVAPEARRYRANADGDVSVSHPVRLSHFLDDLGS
eukprot:CAMPEP_0198230404 /NCGR_PEP_ID=MMETSP1445-20131203/114643_1 /TAXON_ID=36898 /ORGANISM="Pyramimonas sp., Strain CCMP2087" /LENGTH=298 /DNA_ID=CAMNT_0043910941 /DNA_START=654 /DNA_END=1550 /DNA_ORIENTATION=+